ncbi:MAG: SRPBCC family protein [Xanthomonadales bacterium]|nr:SRPBCC family protein [Xanthomonadales bacterium]
MDYSNALGIEYRVVSDGEHNGQPVRIVSGARTYDAEIEELWDAVTNAERIPRWFAPISGDLRLGGRYQLEGNAGGSITRCEPPSALDITWEFYGNVSWVTVRLEAVSDGTRLTLEHLMGKDEQSEAHWKKYGPGATGVGWELGFLGLGLYVTTGEAVIESEAHAWFATAEGKAFIEGCAKGWGDAHIQAGEDSAVAQAMAAETAAFYSGGEHQHEE